MSTPPYGHTATLLSDGKVLVTGGYNDIVFLDSAEIYDPVTDSWSPADTMSTPRYGHTATLLSDGKVLVTGGYNDIVLLDSAEIYDPTTDTWSPADTMSTPRYGHTATLLSDDKVLDHRGLQRYRFLGQRGVLRSGQPISWSPVTTPASRSRSKEDGAADLRYVEEVARVIGKSLDGYKVVVTKSTVPVGTRQEIQEIIRAQDQNGTEGAFDVAVSNPEFLREGSATEDFLRPNRVAIGANSPQAVAILQDLYRPLYLIETPFVITTLASAELIKHALNSFLALKISFINELANLCEVLGVDVHCAGRGNGARPAHRSECFCTLGWDSTAPRFPKDTQALAQIAEQHGRLHPFGRDSGCGQRATEAQGGGSRLPARSEALSSNGDSLKGKTIGLLGLAFKPNSDDVRDAPSITEQAQQLLPDRGILSFRSICMPDSATT